MEPERGHRVTATVKCIKGTCNAGHKVGDVMHVSARNTAGMCGYLYHATHPTILMLQFGGNGRSARRSRFLLRCASSASPI